jgi:hypothetical protein
MQAPKKQIQDLDDTARKMSQVPWLTSIIQLLRKQRSGRLRFKSNLSKKMVRTLFNQ